MVKSTGEVYTPLERLLIMGAPIFRAVNEVIEARNNDQQHPLGMYVREQNSVITLDGSNETVRLVGMHFPLEVLVRFSEAFHAASGTPLGQQLREKIREKRKLDGKGNPDAEPAAPQEDAGARP